MKSINFITPLIGVHISLIKTKKKQQKHWNTVKCWCEIVHEMLLLHITSYKTSYSFSSLHPCLSNQFNHLSTYVNRKTTFETCKSLRNHGLAFILFHVFAKPHTLLDFFDPKYIRDGNLVFCFVYRWFSLWMRFVVDYEWLMKFRCRLLLSPLIQFLYMHLTCWPT